MYLPEIALRLPAWVKPFLDGQPQIFPSREDRMRLAIELSNLNVRHASGGPFGAAVFDEEGRLVAPGMNLVVSSGCSIFHAETVALAFAQKVLGRYDLGDGRTLQYELYASTEPCAMCFGAIPWSGVGALLCGARSEDARAIGFDEGDKPGDWTASLEKRGIRVELDLLRPEAVAVLQDYASSGGVLYNPRKPLPHPLPLTDEG
ncbi:MAG: nucleoside deaminase [Deltaproteobacteria bacterium]|nr:nucleoside deaminase [Deltaproteobacteria bacterium]TLN04088.1 MAG: nucleoside deaminase [bacterium]